MLGFLGRFGRARELRQLDDALRAVDLHPAMVPDAVELAAVRLLQAEKGAPQPHDYAAAAELIGYCMIGADGFAGANDEALAAAVEARIATAIQSGDSLDAKLVLLLLHASVIQPSVIARYALEAV
jgi:hypothetical protein